MRFDKRFCARTAVIAGLVAASVSVFGPSPVHAQTTAQPQGTVRRMSIDDAVATALEQTRMINLMDNMRMGDGDQQPLEGFLGRAVPEMGHPK